LNEKVAETYKRLDEARSSCEKAEADSVAFLKMVEERKQQRLQSIIQKYENSLAELFSDLAAKEQNYRVAIQELQSILTDLSSKERIAYENLQKTLERKFPNRLHLSERSISEMKELYGICNRLSNALPLYKAIYDLYLKVELTDLVRRTGAAGKCGIYRITNVTNGMVYIGQSVNIGER
jgi:DNA repair exonuclease SbcCD ATPase subunit